MGLRSFPKSLVLACCCALFWALPTTGTVVLQTGNISVSFADLPASFGPEIPQEGITGLLQVADPWDACTELKPPASVKAPWVALITRSQQIEGCTFDMKVAHAEQAGAQAAIIYDDVFEPLVLMAKDPRHPEPFIPSVFVSHRSGLMMKRLTEEGRTIVILTPMSEQLWLSMLMSACAGFLAVNVVLGALWVIRRQRIVAGGGGGGGAGAYGSVQARGMSAEEIRRLPIVVYEEPPASDTACAADSAAASRSVEAGGSDNGSDSGRKGGGTRHTCAICLESYSHGEKLRVLPCQHRYHSECVDTWLSNRHPSCPVCKADAHARTPEQTDLEAGGAGAETAGGRGHRAAALFLGRLWAGWSVARRHAVRGGTGQGSASPAGAAARPRVSGSGRGGGGGGEPAEQQLLLATSRSSSPALPAGAPVDGRPQLATPPVAAVAAFSGALPASGGTSPRATATTQPEITPAEAPEAGLTVLAAGSAAATAAVAAASAPRQLASLPQPCPAPGFHSSPRGSKMPVARGSSLDVGSSGQAQLLPDSTEGSETDSGAE